ncbi:MAG: trigger factor, trigger factor [Candidatus Dadabacteria bacterium CSP1-2]|nr:MAG: trigger factor, trigger factor [Candidatus Dadabacteria bacterium CSP1-2]
MKVNVESLSNTEMKVEVFIPKEEVTGKIEEVFKELERDAKIKGFRPGKAPRRVIEAAYGSYIFEEVSSRLVSQSFEKALEEVSIIPISRPRITKDKIERDKEFHYTAVFEVIPEFEVKDYTGIELKKEKREVKEEDLALVLNQLRERGAQAKPIGEDREVRTGDYLIIDYVGVVDGKPIKDLKAKDAQVIVGDKRLMAEFEDNLIGIKKGEEKEFEITYPEDFQMKDVAGKAVNFTVTVKEILERILPELDDEFSKDLGEENLEGLRKRIRGDLEKRFNKESDDMLKGGLIKVLLERNPLDVPPILIENETLRLKREFAINLERHGLKPPVLNDEAEGNFRNRAEQNVKASIILGAIARKEGVQVDEDEVDNKLIEISKSAAVSFQKVREIYEKNNMVDSLKASLVEDKVLNFLIEKSDAKAETQIDKEG